LAHPDGTRAWRKAWRKRWHEGSSYRQLTCLQRELLRWIEENADDDGRAGPTTFVWLARLLSCPTERVSKSAVHRASVALEKAGMVRREAGQAPGRAPGHGPMSYVRENWSEYQGQPSEVGQPPGRKASDPRDNLAEEGRGKQKKQKTTAPEAPLPEGTDWSGLVAAMSKAWAGRYEGAKFVWLGKDWKTLRALVVSLTDTEVWRRWEIYLANTDKFYTGHPLDLFASHISRFVVAPAPDRGFREPWEGESPKGPSEWRETQ
jgi:hypothetical protein